MWCGVMWCRLVRCGAMCKVLLVMSVAIVVAIVVAVLREIRFCYLLFVVCCDNPYLVSCRGLRVLAWRAPIGLVVMFHVGMIGR